MHVLFVHQNYPAQFGHLARHLIRSSGWRCSFVSETPGGDADGIHKIRYKTRGGAREVNHYCSRTFENTIWHAHAVYEACKAERLWPDLIVGHSGFGSTLFLRELYPGVPIINYFEYYYHPHGVDMDFRPDFHPGELDFLRAQARNAMVLLDLDNCRRGYSPTAFQRGLFPPEFQDKIEMIFDGIETELYHRRGNVPRRIAGREIGAGTKIVTYVSRGLEAMRGFDIFMRAAKQIYSQHPDVLFIVVGSDRICYGGDTKYIKHKSFREHVLAQDDYDLSKFLFTGLVPTTILAELLSLSDLHIYLTVPFVLSWSMLDAMACGCVVLASNTAPVQEVITHGEDGLLVDFFDVEGFAAQALAVLRDPGDYRPVGERAAQVIRERYALDVCLPRIKDLFEKVSSGSPAQGAH